MTRVLYVPKVLKREAQRLDALILDEEQRRELMEAHGDAFIREEDAQVALFDLEKLREQRAEIALVLNWLGWPDEA